ncbi:hypothetical protein SH580_15855 [Coraliomargarita algicola]|uniref:Type 4 fimbrial biogenesis protein PilX N-terminal domain-containing protein n=1 Tax=Coraliomargarita algicola TaxID=3092156 RepID=A0ABZ0RFE8_9BACT|nr:hypothetical protein [Coraliomargarita sp. J2-16]WPJ94905.1 hypothetical protein SH580_15855 [Coraliomargarita sp. J2-16]
MHPAHSAQTAKGFALLLALTLMSFVVLLMLSLSTMIQVDIRAAESAARTQKAQTNALLGLQVALGELQNFAGPDTRVTARADIYGTSDTSPCWAWTGVWDSQDPSPAAARSDHTLRRAYQATNGEAKPPPLAWLASGIDGSSPANIDPTNPNIPSDRQVLMLSAETTISTPPVIVGKKSITSNSGGANGSYAWWVGDEGVKARINVSDPFRDENQSIEHFVGPSFNLINEAQKTTLLDSSLALTPGIQQLGGPWGQLTESELELFNKAFSYESLRALLKLSSEAEASLFNAYKHDLTVYSQSLQTDTRKGGFKKDLTMAFESPTVFEHFFGVQATNLSFTRTDREEDQLFQGVMEFPVAEVAEPPSEFYLCPELQRINKLTDVGPNWGSLYSYYNLYKLDDLATDGAIKPILAYPVAGGPNEVPDALPYKNYQKYYHPDEQHTNSPITPILERFQLHIRVGSTSEEVDGVDKYKLRFYLQPMLAMWNPYNVKLKRAYPNIDQNNFYPQYRFSFEAAPELVISGEFDDGTPFNETINIANAYMKGEGNNQYTQGVWAALAPADLEFMPGEIRILSATADASGNFRENELDYGWQDSEGFYFDWPFKYSHSSYVDKYVADKAVTVHSVQIKERNDDWFVGGSKGDQLSGAYWQLIHETPSDTNKNNSNLIMQSSSGFWKDPVYASEHPDAELSPGTLEDGTIPPFLPSQRLGSNYLDIGTWLFHLRTTNEANNGLRNLIDSNPRALYSAPRWDGPGLFAQGAFQGGGDQQNGYLAAGSVPEPSIGDFSRYTGLNGPSISDSSLGQSQIILFDVPRFPAVSIGQFQHANLSRYNFEPSYLVGNSYANTRIPLDSTYKTSFEDNYGLNLFDTAYMVNDQIFDEYFLSTVSPKISDANWSALVAGEKSPYNARHRVIVPSASTRSELLDLNDTRAMLAWGGRIIVQGGFNINSTSVKAWKALFSSMDQPFLRIDVSGTDAQDLSLTDPDGVYVSRTSLPIYESGYSANAADSDAFKAFFKGYRKLSDSELDALAEATVEEVKSRGPFLSLADFINRRLNATNAEAQTRGTLQAALDRTINQNIHASIASEAINLSGSTYNAVLSNEHPDSQATGHSGYVLQGDLLQPLAPILSPRSDTFVIRAYGSADSITGESDEAWCEAVVQRFPDMTGTGNDLSDGSLNEFIAESDALTNPTNQAFGRKFQIIAFRWLSEDEL